MGSFGDGLRFGEGGVVMWYCPACRCGHGGKLWKRTAPGTVAPSLVCTVDDKLCHSSVANGQIHYHSDCTNGWANRVVDLDKDW